MEFGERENAKNVKKWKERMREFYEYRRRRFKREDVVVNTNIPSMSFKFHSPRGRNSTRRETPRARKGAAAREKVETEGRDVLWR